MSSFSCLFLAAHWSTWVHGQHAKGPASAGPQERLGRGPSSRRESAPCPGTNAHAPGTSTWRPRKPDEGEAVSPGMGGREAGPLQSPTRWSEGSDYKPRRLHRIEGRPQPARYNAPNGCVYKAPTYEEMRQHRNDADEDRTLSGIVVLTVRSDDPYCS